MFTRIFNSIKENAERSSQQDSRHGSFDGSSSICSERRPSVVEECDHVLTRFSSQMSSEARPITKGRRGSMSVFGISNVAFDDYVQKDLVSSSWS
ncbi:hypothetical protein BY458DRAFT_510425 [Sporodiniella umbellata]|nr:hypothetical protein BY458DRAFT_510425 [Sporodiniella umbellata]